MIWTTSPSVTRIARSWPNCAPAPDDCCRVRYTWNSMLFPLSLGRGAGGEVMEQFVIEGGPRLSGEIEASGNKNAALKLMAACLLTDEPVTLHNWPNIRDARMMADILADLGATVEWRSGGSVYIHARNIRTHKINPKLAQQFRASIVVAGPMLARLGHLEIAAPGGDVIGHRRLD